MSAPPALHSVLDIEASGFGAGSVPIEVGWVTAEGQAGCMLVRPPAHWTHWDAAAERVHGIPRAVLLAHGHSPLKVARRLNDALRGQVVYCNGWGHDYSWLARLFDEAGLLPAFNLQPATRLLADGQLERMDGAHRAAYAELAVSRHRASNDARALQRALQRLMDPAAEPL